MSDLRFEGALVHHLLQSQLSLFLLLFLVDCSLSEQGVLDLHLVSGRNQSGKLVDLRLIGELCRFALFFLFPPLGSLGVDSLGLHALDVQPLSVINIGRRLDLRLLWTLWDPPWLIVQSVKDASPSLMRGSSPS